MVTEISLAVIAAACVVAAGAGVPALVQFRRTAARAENVLAELERTLPALVIEARAVTARADRTLAAMDGVLDTIARMDRLTTAAARSLEGAGAIMRQMAAGTIAPTVTNAVGLLAALREGIQWIWPRRERRGGLHD
ncbi:MAG TPA: hypothetical protein VKW09_14090 [bacterium]|nr:hypothetical protein [bacterium]